MGNLRRLLLLLPILWCVNAYALTPIAIDATSHNETSSAGTTLSDTHVVSGSNRILLAWVASVKNGTQAAPTSVTWNGVESMTKIANTEQQASVGATQHQGAWWYLIAPSTGSHSISATWASSRDQMAIIAYSLTGAKQSAQPDASTSVGGYFGDTGSGSTLNITTVANNSKILAVCTSDLLAPKFSAPFLSRTSVTSLTNHQEFSMDVRKLLAGIQPVTFTNTAFSSGIVSVVSLAPADATTPTSPYYIKQSTGSDEADGSLSTPFKTAANLATKDSLVCGDKVYASSGETWTEEESVYFGQIDSTCTTAGQYIKFRPYGSGNPPKIAGGAIYGGSWVSDGSGVYHATGITYTVNAVSVDETTGLWDARSASVIAGTFYYDSGASIVYVKLSDSSNPASHTVRFGRYPTSEGGLLNPSQIAYNARNNQGFLFEGFDIVASNYYGILSTGTKNTWSRVRIYASAHEALYDSTYGTWDGSYNLFEFISSYYACAKGNGQGQGITISGSHNDILYPYSAYSGMASIDFLNSSATNTDSSFNFLHGGIFEYGSAWPGGNLGYSNYDPGMYCDGCTDTIWSSCIVRYTGLANGTNSSIGLSAYSENPTQRNVANLYWLNNLSYGNSYFAFQIASNGTNIAGSWLMGNDFIRGDSTYAVGAFYGIATDGLKIYYNIFDNRGAAYPLQTISISDMTAYKGDYNVSSDNWYTQTHGSSTMAYIYSTFGEEQHSVVADPLLVNVVSDASIDAHLQVTSPALNFNDGSQWSNLPSWVQQKIGGLQPRGYVLVAGTKDNGTNKANGYHFAAGTFKASGATIKKSTIK